MRINLGIATVVSMLVMGFGASSSAQQPRDPSTPVSTVDDRRDGTDWGWLGLTGLIGLAGLLRRESHARPLVRSEVGVSAAR